MLPGYRAGRPMNVYNFRIADAWLLPEEAA